MVENRLGVDRKLLSGRDMRAATTMGMDGPAAWSVCGWESSCARPPREGAAVSLAGAVLPKEFHVAGRGSGQAPPW